MFFSSDFAAPIVHRTCSRRSQMRCWLYLKPRQMSMRNIAVDSSSSILVSVP